MIVRILVILENKMGPKEIFAEMKLTMFGSSASAHVSVLPRG